MGDAAALSLAPGFDSGILRLGGPAEAGYRRRTTTSSAQLSNPPGEEARLLRSLRNGDEQAFTRLLHEYSPAMLRVAMLYVGSRTVAEEVVQEAWLGVIAGLHRFEGRSTVKIWVFRTLTNIAKTRAIREGRTVPLSSLETDDEEYGGAVDPARFHPPGSTWVGHWQSVQAPARPEKGLLVREARDRIEVAIDALPARQRAVLTLRDLAGFSAEDACDLIGISEINQRLLLHRARTKVRSKLEQYLEETK